jgi:hypothetical protein
MSKHISISFLAALIVILPGCRQLPPAADITTRSVEPLRYNNNSGIRLENKEITINWEAVHNADAYNISRAASRLGNYIHLASVTETFFTDNAPNPNKYENYYKITAKNNNGIVSETLISFELQLFGPNMRIYNIAYEKMSDIQSEINHIHDTQMLGSIVDSEGRKAEFSDKRYAFYFKPGNYKNFNRIRIGFYTQAAGLGKTPVKTKL